MPSRTTKSNTSTKSTKSTKSNKSTTVKPTTSNRTTYTSSKCKDVVWNKASLIRGKNPTTIRKDPYGNTINYNSYGKTTPTGWQIDHIKPKSRGGSNDILNLQALQYKVNIQKGGTLVKKSRHSG